MDWREPVIDYCERLDHGFWAEPLNAATNAAFLVAAASAFLLWRRMDRADIPALLLILVTASVGLGSFVFHTVATRGAMLLDVIPIAVFIYGYFLLALRRFFGLGVVGATAITLLFCAGSFTAEGAFHGLNGSVAYLPALAALASFAALLASARGFGARLADRRIPTAKALGAAASVFVVSLFFRTIDRDLCPTFSLGAHFLWHLLNACVLWMLLRAAILAAPRGKAL